ncbi:type III secretion system outer membrane ring subunit SctC [Trinickia fusca]|uniref:Type 3 secretion system secretin n=1 Tax=Trinickia fusca TaxID=2419777 RepID=A0A494X985_9BURK|nr:type III secretion system outer membrane ring subunit SctC [Trinickia fusca]RKP44649.1 EscC/YscC/HrcC family type III secretion system outer membrane ring protein [Trinickia fusca]
MCAAPASFATAVHWKTSSIAYSAEGKDVKDVLRDFAASQGIPANIGGEVAGTVSGRFNMPPQRFLDTLASTFGFVWYYDGQVLDIVMPAEMKNSLLKLDSASAEQLRRTLTQLGVADNRFPLIYDDSQGAVIVNGPPSYVQMVTSVADRIDKNASRRSGTEIRVYPLRHAWAVDRTVDVDGQQVTLAGVASLLNSMYHPPSQSMGGAANGAAAAAGVMRSKSMSDVAGSASGGYNSKPGTPPLPPLPQATGPLGGLSGQPSQGIAQAANNAPAQDNDQASGSKDDSLPVIQADPRTNSVLVRDLPDRMYQYPDLLERLDVKPQLIEIEAHIIEVDDNALQQLGVDWTAHNSHVDIQTGGGVLPQNTYNGTLTQTFGTTSLNGTLQTPVPVSPTGLSMAAVLGDAGRYLMTRIDALTQTNRAKIDSSPKVTTLNNLEAVMANKTRFFVPVSGYTSADLYSVSTGVSLRVLPMIVEENGSTQIKLDVSIEDGEVTDQTVGNLPVITSSDINTSAFIKQGQALLVAGYRVDNRKNGVAGVPGLSKIPVIGNLFKTASNNDSHMERLFLLTPRIVEP